MKGLAVAAAACAAAGVRGRNGGEVNAGRRWFAPPFSFR
jgi:hypothetical protein